jgi:ArsR family transcriptional regulator
MMTALFENFAVLEKKAEMIKTLGHPIRLCIMEVLADHNEKTVTEIYTDLEIEQAVASHHLRILKNSGVLSSSKKGKNVLYSISHDNLKEIFDLLIAI